MGRFSIFMKNKVPESLSQICRRWPSSGAKLETKLFRPSCTGCIFFSESWTGLWSSIPSDEKFLRVRRLVGLRVAKTAQTEERWIWYLSKMPSPEVSSWLRARVTGRFPFQSPCFSHHPHCQHWAKSWTWFSWRTLTLSSWYFDPNHWYTGSTAHWAPHNSHWGNRQTANSKPHQCQRSSRVQQRWAWPIFSEHLKTTLYRSVLISAWSFIWVTCDWFGGSCYCLDIRWWTSRSFGRGWIAWRRNTRWFRTVWVFGGLDS